MKRFFAVVSDPWRRIPVVSVLCGEAGNRYRQIHRSGAGCGVPQIPLWLTASGFAIHVSLRRQFWFAVLSLS